MIAKITLENFFSFAEPTVIELNPDINILVGINGSGKSNFLRAIRLLFEGIAGEGFEKIFLKDWSGFSSVANFNGNQKEYIKITYEFDKTAINKAINSKGYNFKSNPVYEIKIHPAGNTSYFLEESIYIRNSEKKGTPFVLLEMKDAQGIISTRENGKIGIQRYPHRDKKISFKPAELVLSQISEPDRYYPLFTLKHAIESLAVYYYFDTTLKSPIRQPGSFGIEEKLLPDAQNLMSVLMRIKNYHSLQYEQIEERIKNINPNFKDINFDLLGSKMFLVLREQFLARSVSIEHISDGTLRYLILLSILFNPERGYVVCLDEPEIGLHPDMINSIAQSIKYASVNGTQLIIATHSPLLLNAFELANIIIFEKDKNNKTIISRKAEEDFDEWNDNFLVGQLWLRGLIGGKRW
jgi:predicted ATPase